MTTDAATATTATNPAAPRSYGASGIALSGASAWPVGDVLRDVVRAGIAALVVGIVVAGMGGRLAMRLAALLVPSATGRFTENGFEIGVMTASGSLGLVIFGGLLGTVFLATIWVVISPWLPASAGPRALVAAPIAVALGAVAVIDGGNADFVILSYDPAVVAILIALVAATAPAMVVTDRWLDRRMPRATDARSPLAVLYAGLAGFGGLLAVVMLMTGSTDPKAVPFVLTIIGTGAFTLAWWARRIEGAETPPRTLLRGARVALLVGTALGFATVIPEVAAALGRY